MKEKSLKTVGCLLLLLSCTASSVLYADMAEIKKYKEAFPEEKIKCAACHTAAMPKKDGDHSLNAYGQKVVESGTPTTAENYKTAGKA